MGEANRTDGSYSLELERLYLKEYSKGRKYDK